MRLRVLESSYKIEYNYLYKYFLFPIFITGTTSEKQDIIHYFNKCEITEIDFLGGGGAEKVEVYIKITIFLNKTYDLIKCYKL